MVEFWSERARKFRNDPAANANDVWIREIEISSVAEIVEQQLATDGGLSVLDFGCANGYSTMRLARDHPSANFLAVDINREMIATARSGLEEARVDNLEFQCIDILKVEFDRTFDVIYGMRVFQNMDSPETQERYFSALADCLNPGGRLITIESYADGYETLNADRDAIALPSLPLHSHLTRLQRRFDDFAAERLTLEKKSNPFSSYHLITRIVYSWYAKEMGEEIDYDHPLHRIAALAPSYGDYGPMRLRVYRNGEASRAGEKDDQ